MQIYINKNGQQFGPFDEAKVLEMLRSGKLLPTDLGIEHGQTNWQKLEVIFPQLTRSPNVAPIATPNSEVNPPPRKSGISKGLIFGIVGGVGLLLIGLIGVIALVSISLNRSSSNLANNNSNTSTNSTKPAPQNTPNIPADFTALTNKAEELATLSPPQKPETNPIIKGKIAIVEKDGKSDAKMLGIDYTGKKLYQYDLDRYGFSTNRLAFTPEEIDTLIQLNCNKGGRLGTYEGGIPAFSNVCKATIIDYKNSAIVAQKTFTNKTPPTKIETSSSTSEFVLSKPDEFEEFLSGLPLEKLANPLIEMPFDDQKGTYGKYTGFMNLAAELVRTTYPEQINANATIKGKIAFGILDRNKAELKGFDGFGKEKCKYDCDNWGVGAERVAENVGEIDTLIKINCKKGTRLGTVKRVSVFSNQCEVSIVDYKNSVTIAKKTFENKEMNRDIDTEVYDSQYVVLSPRSEIEQYIKGFPK